MELDLTQPLKGQKEITPEILDTVLEIQQETNGQLEDEAVPENYRIENYYTADTLGADVLKNKYLAPWETHPWQIWKRQAVAMASVEKTKRAQEKWEEKFFSVLEDFRFVPGGRIMHGAGREDITTTLNNCYVMAVKELMRQLKINPKRAKAIISGISGSTARIKQITVMDMPTEELDSAMTFEARKHVPLDGTDTIIDYQILGSNSVEVDKIDIGLVACTKGAMENHMGLIKDCGMKPGIVDVYPIAISNLFNYVKDMPDDGLVVILDIGAVSSTLIVNGKGQQYFTRDLPIGGHHFVKQLVEKKELKYVEAQDLLFKEGLASILNNKNGDGESGIGLSQRSI